MPVGAGFQIQPEKGSWDHAMRLLWHSFCHGPIDQGNQRSQSPFTKALADQAADEHSGDELEGESLPTGADGA